MNRGQPQILIPAESVYLTGDVHGRFDRVIDCCIEHQVGKDDTFVILGDAGLNYYGDGRDTLNKMCLAELSTTFFCVHGNHEMRPSPELGYELREFHGGKLWVEPAYPNIVFAVDGEVYAFCGHFCIVIGGAYSVDKYYRLSRGWSWWADEQPSDEVKARVENALTERDWKIDVVLSHTCPLRYEPVEAFLPMADQSTVDKSTERWLDEIESRLTYQRWYCGHYHIEKRIDRLRFMYNDYDVSSRRTPRALCRLLQSLGRKRQASLIPLRLLSKPQPSASGCGLVFVCLSATGALCALGSGGGLAVCLRFRNRAQRPTALRGVLSGVLFESSVVC